MRPDELFHDIHMFCVSNADESIVKKYSRYFKTGYPGYGIAGELYEEKVKSLKADPELTLSLLLEAAPLLIRTGKYEETTFAIRLLLGFSKQFEKSTFDHVAKWFDIGITNWAHTDYLCGEVMNLFFKKNIITLDTIGSWRIGNNKFQRRAAVVSLIKPMKLSSEFGPYFEFISPMMMDPEREVHQGLGWFLREAWKKQNEPTEAFLLKWKDQSARLIFQYATEKMTAEQKTRFKRTK